MKKESPPVYETESRKLIYELNHKLSLLGREISRLDKEGESTLSRKAQEYFLSYTGVLDTAVEKGEISKDEQALLESIGRGYKDYKKEFEKALDEEKISPIEAAKMETRREEVLKKAMDQAMEDGVITEEERSILVLLKEAERSGEDRLGWVVLRLRRDIAIAGGLFNSGDLSAKEYPEELKRILDDADGYLKKVSTLNKLRRHKRE